jgi:hypothetical protein
MTDIVRVTEEEFDAEGNLTRRVITEYGVAPSKFAKGGVVPTTLQTGEEVIRLNEYVNPNKYQVYNGAYGVDPHGTFGTRQGVVVE